MITTIRQITVILAISIACASVNFLVNPSPAVWVDPYSITAENAIALGNKAVWIDARSAEQFAREHKQGAVHLTERDWNSGIEDFLLRWEPTQEIIVYCDSGGCRTGHHVAKHLSQDLGVVPRVVLGGWGAVQHAITNSKINP